MVKKIIKIAIVGKAGSGKDTVYKLIHKNRLNTNSTSMVVKKIAFADPVKEIAKIMFPFLTKNILYGPSRLRATEIPNSFKDGKPLTVRQLLIDIGTGLGRSYNEQIWIDNFEQRILSYVKKHSNQYPIDYMIVATDVRFRNEFDIVKNKGFYMIKLERNNHANINDISETQQDEIKDNEFHFILKNNGTIKELEKKIVDKLMPAVWNSV